MWEFSLSPENPIRDYTWHRTLTLYSRVSLSIFSSSCEKFSNTDTALMRWNAWKKPQSCGTRDEIVQLFFFPLPTDLQLSALLAWLSNFNTTCGEQEGAPNAQGITSHRPIASDLLIFLGFFLFLKCTAILISYSICSSEQCRGNPLQMQISNTQM